jgi:hypothetical protein
MFCSLCGCENPDNKTLCLRCRKPLAITPAGRGALALAARAVRRGRRHQAAATHEPQQ